MSRRRALNNHDQQQNEEIIPEDPVPLDPFVEEFYNTQWRPFLVFLDTTDAHNRFTRSQLHMFVSLEDIMWNVLLRDRPNTSRSRDRMRHLRNDLSRTDINILKTIIETVKYIVDPESVNFSSNRGGILQFARNS